MCTPMRPRPRAPGPIVSAGSAAAQEPMRSARRFVKGKHGRRPYAASYRGGRGGRRLSTLDRCCRSEKGLEKVFGGQDRYGSELPDSDLALSADVVDAEVVESSEETRDIVGILDETAHKSADLDDTTA